MPEENKAFELNEIIKDERSKKKTVKKEVKKEKIVRADFVQEKPKEKTKSGSSYSSLVVVVVIIFIVIGVMFGYTRAKIGEVKQDSTDTTKTLKQQLAQITDAFGQLQEKAANLEKENTENKAVVLDLYEKNRRIPSDIKTDGWSLSKIDTLSFGVYYPGTWMAVAPILKADDATKGEELLTLQPKGQPEFADAITIKNAYPELAKLSITEKRDTFADLALINVVDFTEGKMMYFINIDPTTKAELPTILILTKNNIYQATFNITNKDLSGYFQFRKDFEDIVSTFETATRIKEALKAASEAQKNTP